MTVGGCLCLTWIIEWLKTEKQKQTNKKALVQHSEGVVWSAPLSQLCDVTLSSCGPPLAHTGAPAQPHPSVTCSPLKASLCVWDLSKYSLEVKSRRKMLSCWWHNVCTAGVTSQENGDTQGCVLPAGGVNDCLAPAETMQHGLPGPSRTMDAPTTKSLCF